MNSSPFDNTTDYQINQQTSSSFQQAQNPAHHVSLCVNDLRTTLYIEEDALNSTKTTVNSNNTNNGGKGI